jgi:Na+-driven multidrug efflux pump
MAKRLTRVSCLVAAGVIVAYSLVIFFTRTAIVGVFTDDATVLAETKSFWNYLSVFILLDSAWYVSSCVFYGRKFLIDVLCCCRGVQRGIILGLGLQKYMAVAMILSLWCVGLPLMRFLAFHEKHGLVGIWQTMPVCYILLDIGLALTYALPNWSKISLQVQARNAPKHANDDDGDTTAEDKLLPMQDVDANGVDDSDEKPLFPATSL